MTPEQFCYWLQGFVENDGRAPNDKQWLSIKNHLNTVFNKRTPDILKPYDPGPLKEYKEFKIPPTIC